MSEQEPNVPEQPETGAVKADPSIVGAVALRKIVICDPVEDGWFFVDEEPEPTYGVGYPD